MKIITYNVNGIRAAQKKGLAEWLGNSGADIVCIQETKAHPEQVDMSDFAAEGFVHTAWHSCSIKKGYSGVLTLSKVEPNHIENGCLTEVYDQEGRVVRTDFGDLTILNCYFPNGGQGEERQNFKYRFLDDFLTYAVELQKERPKLLVVGDYNIAHEEMDLHNPARNHDNTGFLPDERTWMTKWFDQGGFIDSLRHLHPEKVVYSWWSYRANARNNNKGWRIDYQSLTKAFADDIVSLEHFPEVKHSDHCAILLELK
jgi:exodeoxyribonuclease-3